MRDGDVRVEGRELYMTRDTYRTVMAHPSRGVVWDLMLDRGAGTWPVPVTVLRADEAEDVRNALAFAERGPSATCALPTCLQPTAVQRDGYSLCEGHDLL